MKRIKPLWISLCISIMGSAPILGANPEIDEICYEDAQTTVNTTVPALTPEEIKAIKDSYNIIKNSVVINPLLIDGVDSVEILDNNKYVAKLLALKTKFEGKIDKAVADLISNLAGIAAIKPNIIFDGTYEYCKGQRETGTWKNLKTGTSGLVGATAKGAVEFEGNIGAEAGASFVGHAAGGGEVKIQYKGELTLGVNLELPAQVGTRPPRNKPTLVVFTDPNYSYTRGIAMEVQQGVSVALGIDLTIHKPGARVEKSLVAGQIIKDKKVIGTNKPVCVTTK